MVDPRPTRLRRWLRKALCWTRHIGWLLLTHFRIEAVRWDGPDWSVVFVHDYISHSSEELRYLLFPSPPREAPLGQMLLWSLPSAI